MSPVVELVLTSSGLCIFNVSHQPDKVAEWLRRWTANPLCSARVGSNPILVEFFFFTTSKCSVQNCATTTAFFLNPSK